MPRGGVPRRDEGPLWGVRKGEGTGRVSDERLRDSKPVGRATGDTGYECTFFEWITVREEAPQLGDTKDGDDESGSTVVFQNNNHKVGPKYLQ